MTFLDLITALKDHDWTYDYSDDLRDYYRGMNQRRVIVKGLAMLSKIEREVLIGQYCVSVEMENLRGQVEKEVIFMMDKEPPDAA